MKFLIGVVLVLTLCAGALLWPVAGRSVWARAEERGIPRAAARMAARGLRSAWDLVSRHSPPKAASAPTHGAPAHSPPRVATAQRTGTGTHASGEAHGGPDRIVAQPPKEKLGAQDRADLQKLIAH